jgi:hypothetical protein
LESGYPLGIGSVLEVRTDIKVNQKEIIDKVRLTLNNDPLSA